MRFFIIWFLYLCLIEYTNGLDDWKVFWSDEFDGESLNNQWKYEVNCDGGGNNELQCYTNSTENLVIKDGILTIRAKPQKLEYKNYTSARIRIQSKGWTYGRFEAKARLSRGKHLWPAIWLLPSDSVYGTWAASGEIDILEYRGQKTNEIIGAIHYGGSWPHQASSVTKSLNTKQDLSENFHIYAIEWSETHMKWFFDDNNFHTEKMDRDFYSGGGLNPYNKTGQPFDQNFQWVINMAVGGNFFPSKEYGDLSYEEALKWEKPYIEVDYVRVYHHKNSFPKISISKSSIILTLICCIVNLF